MSGQSCLNIKLTLKNWQGQPTFDVNINEFGAAYLLIYAKFWTIRKIHFIQISLQKGNFVSNQRFQSDHSEDRNDRGNSCLSHKIYLDENI